MSCDPGTLLDSAKCFNCLSIPQLEAIQSYLLCQINGTGGGIKGYSIALSYSGGASPADSTTYFLGLPNSANIANQTTFALNSIEVPKTGTIVRVFVKVRITGTLGTSETVQHFIEINGATDCGEIDLTYDATGKSGSATVVGQAVTAGDTIALKVVAPAWVTNPTGVNWYALVYIE